MKQITEIDDPRLVKALAHPLRVNILRVLQERVASPSELADELSAPLGNVSYHVRFLERVGLLELVHIRPRRGAVEHYYRAVGRVRITDGAWAQVPEIIKNAMVSATLDQTVQFVGAAASAGGFDRGDAKVSRRAITLDKQGFSDLGEALMQLLERASQIEAESAERLAATNHESRDINTGLVLMLFEAAAAEASSPAPRARARRARTRSV